MANPLIEVGLLGQSLWYDNIRRGLFTSGQLQRLIDEDGLRGVTANPSIFEKAIGGSTDYDKELEELGRRNDLDAKSIYERLAIRDIQDAADLLRPTYDKLGARDGYVSLEVSPALANDTRGTVAEARRLWKVIRRENAMIKVPATPAGVPAIRTLIGEGININVTLLFGIEVYQTVAEAYLAGLEALATSGGKLERVASVASFFVSRVDTLVESLAMRRFEKLESQRDRAIIQGILGKVGVANAKLAYQRYKQIFSGPRWGKLVARGAQSQRLLWASTSTKNPSLRDVYYVEELIGPDTVDTVPPATLDAFRDHGRAEARLEQGLKQAQEAIDALAQVGISMKEVAAKLIDDGVRLFSDAFEKLLASIEKRRIANHPTSLNRLTYQLPPDLLPKLSAALEDWEVGEKGRRLWARDASLWTGTDEAKWLGWLGVTEEALAHLQPLEHLAEEVKKEGFSHLLLMGMGGSSLCPEVFKETFGTQPGFPELCVLDSTDPSQIRHFEQKLDLRRTLFIVSTKSGTTLEPNIFQQYFLARAQQVVDAGSIGGRFMAITDPGSKMQEVAQRNHFRHIFLGVPSIGGRYSALSNFGLVPAAAMGLDVARLLDRADLMVHSCSACVPGKDNPGALLGNLLGVLGASGRDKVTLVTSPEIRDFGAWLEQLLAESTGKEGKGLIPVDRELLAAPEHYGRDRVFAYLRLDSAPDLTQDARIAVLEQAGHPVIRVHVAEPYDLAQEFFRWEFATAVAGSVLGINPFNQPDVEASKQETRKLTSEYEQNGSLPEEKPFFQADGVQLFADPRNTTSIREIAQRGIGSGQVLSLAGYLKAHLSQLRPGDYFALLAYLEMNDPNEKVLQAIRHLVRDRTRVATCVGFGPRFLHSTGQAYKGGPNTGVFLQITCADASDLEIPGQKFSFGVVKAAQARGDFQVLADRGRRALRVHLASGARNGLDALQSAATAAFA